MTAAVNTRYASQLTSDQLEYITNHHKHQPRSRIAKRVGIPKVILTFVCLELGLIKEE